MHGSSAGTPVPVGTYGGLVTLARPESLPEGASPRTYDTDFLVGSVGSRAGLTSVFSTVTASVGPNGGGSTVANFWANPNNILLNDSAYATLTYPVSNTEFLKVQTFGFSIPGSDSPTGVQVVLTGFATGAVNLGVQVQLLVNNVPAGTPKVVFFDATPSSITLGSATDLWGTGGLPASSVNNTTFGLQITGFENTVGVIALNYVTIQIGLNTGTANFNFIGTFTAQNGDIKNILLDAEGNLYVQFIGNSFGLPSFVPLDLTVTNTSLISGVATYEYAGLPQLALQPGQLVSVTGTTNGAGVFNVTNAVIATVSAPFAFVPFFTVNGLAGSFGSQAESGLAVVQLTADPTQLMLIRTDITPGSYAVGINGPDVEYMAFNNGFTGSDMPLQITPNWIDRITQVGPGAAPVFTPSSASDTDFPIINITQPAPNPFGSSFAHGLQSEGPGSNSPGTVVTIYYADATTTTGDPDLIAAFDTGNPVYLFATYTASSGGDTTGSLTSPANFLVTSIGEAVPPRNSRKFYYFTYSVATPQYVWNPGQEGFNVVYNRTLATLTTTEPVPGVVVGSQITVSGNSVANWNTNWIITQTPNASEMAITQSALTAGLATFSYATVNATAAPVAGQLVTITGTLNAGGQLNVAGWPIQSVSGSSTGTFTVNGFSAAADFVAEPEDGAATTAGTIFNFDPGAALVGTTTNPIFGTGTGGNLVFNPTGLFVDPGTYQGTVFFITRNGYFTAPAPPVVFSVPENTTSLTVSNIPIGPPNVTGRGIAITEAGQNGVPGGNFFTLPTAVKFYNLDVPYTATSFYLLDNVSTTLNLFYSLGDIIDESLAIDVYGYNLFNQIEIGDPAWIVNYDSRNFYGLCNNKLQNFVNLSFDGGYLPATKLIPLGWTTPDNNGSLVVSPKFGDAYYIKNGTGSTQAVAGLISQSAFQDANQVPIINANTAYSVRVTARIPSGLTAGSLLISLTASGITYGSFSLPFASMTTDDAIYSGQLLINEFATVPSALTLNVAATGIANLADVEIDRIEVFPTAIPLLGTTVYGSYAGLPEQVDSVTGQVQFISENQQPVYGAVVMYDTFYGLKAWGGKNPGASMYSLQSSANLEPAQWNEPEVSQRSGAIGTLAYDFGKQWLVMAHRNGIDLFEGGQPGKINHEIFQIWDAINWGAAQTIWVRNDETKRRLLIGVPLPTPNFWLPNAPINAAPTSPNVILMCNYQGLDSGEALKQSPQMHTTMFGTLNAIDMRRKWSIWQIPSPFAAICAGSTDEQVYICNGVGNSKVYILDDTAQTDDGVFIDALYTTAGLVELAKRFQMPGMGWARQRWGYLIAALTSTGLVNITLYPNQILAPPYPPGYNFWTIPGGFMPGSPALNDIESSLNFVATRTFVEFRENDGGIFGLSNLVLYGKADVWNKLRGAK